jgi:thiol-disulfide isomerase/thioredoxin
MRRFFGFLLSALLVLAMSGCTAGDPPRTQESEHLQADEGTAPNFTVLDENGNSVRLSDYRGKPVVLNFWATWCYYCKVEMPDFNQAYQKYPDVQFLMVNATDGVQDTVEGVKAFIEDNGYEFDVFFDTEYNAVYAYHITGFPATFFINENGYLITRASGRLNAESLERGIEMIAQTVK